MRPGVATSQADATGAGAVQLRLGGAGRGRYPGEVREYKAIAAMAANRVIGRAGAIPWRLPEDFRWFKQATGGQILVMGRRTYESIGRPLPGRRTLVMTRGAWTAPGVETVHNEAELAAAVHSDPREVWVAGGAEIYAALLPRCSDLYLTRVAQYPEGDAFFPPFEAEFALVGEVLRTADFTVEHYQARRRLLA